MLSAAPGSLTHTGELSFTSRSTTVTGTLPYWGEENIVGMELMDMVTVMQL